MSSDIECGADSKLNLFEIINKFLKDIYEARNLAKFPTYVKSYTKAQTFYSMSGANDFFKAEHYLTVVVVVCAVVYAVIVLLL